MDISDFNPSGDRAVTSTMREMALDSLVIGDIFIKSRFHTWILSARGNNFDIQFRHDKQVVRVPIRMVYDEFAVVARELNYKDTDSRTKMNRLAKRMLLEASGRIEAFYTASCDDMDAPICHPSNYYLLAIHMGSQGG